MSDEGDGIWSLWDESEDGRRSRYRTILAGINSPTWVWSAWMSEQFREYVTMPSDEHPLGGASAEIGREGK